MAKKSICCERPSSPDCGCCSLWLSARMYERHSHMSFNKGHSVHLLFLFMTHVPQKKLSHLFCGKLKWLIFSHLRTTHMWYCLYHEHEHEDLPMCELKFKQNAQHQVVMMSSQQSAGASADFGWVIDFSGISISSLLLCLRGGRWKQNAQKGS